MEVEPASRQDRLGCARCGQVRLGIIEQQRTFEVGFDAPLVVRVESTGCERCGRLAKPAAVARAAAMAALRVVAMSGRVNGESFRFLRSTMGLQAKEVAHMLGLGVGTISRWENDVRDLDPRAWTLLACLALEYIDGDGDPRTKKVLDAVREPHAVPTQLEVRV